MPCCKARLLAEQAHVAPCLVGGLAEPQTEKGREWQEGCQPDSFACIGGSKGLGRSGSPFGLGKEGGSSAGVQLGTKTLGHLKAERVGSFFSFPKGNGEFFK